MSAVETGCKMDFARTVTDARLTNLDLNRFIPLMICRLIMSLKKAATSHPTHISIEVPTETPVTYQDTQGTESIQLSEIKKQQV